MARVDPRLADVTLLVLAAKRRVAARPAAWEHTVGLAALLETARSLPQRDPWSLEGVEDGSGLARLLKEARARGKEQGHGES